MCHKGNPNRLLDHWMELYSRGNAASFFKTSRTKAEDCGVWSDEWVLDKLKRDTNGNQKMDPHVLVKVCGGLHFEIALALHFLMPDFEMLRGTLLHLTDEQKRQLKDRECAVESTDRRRATLKPICEHKS